MLIIANLILKIIFIHLLMIYNLSRLYSIPKNNSSLIHILLLMILAKINSNPINYLHTSTLFLHQVYTF